MSYYKDQFKKLGNLNEYPFRIKIKGSTGETNNINLNEESINDIIDFLHSHKEEIIKLKISQHE